LAAWVNAVRAKALFISALWDETVAPVTISATVVPNSNLVEIRMLTHTSASRSYASIHRNGILGLLRRVERNYFLIL
jgi:hypothetical protein